MPGGRIGFRRGTSGAPGGGDPGMTSAPEGKGQTFGGTLGGGEWNPGVGGTQHIPTVAPDRGVTNYVKQEAKKVPGFIANLGVANKLNIPYLLAATGTDYLKNKFFNRDKNTLQFSEEEDDVINYGKAISDEQSPYGKALSIGEKNAADAAALKKRFDPNDQSTWAQGGRVGLYAGGDPEEPAEDIHQFMQDQGVPGGDMVEGDPFQMRIQELMGKGMSWDDAYEIAEMEFQDLFAEGPEQDPGIASLV